MTDAQTDAQLEAIAQAVREAMQRALAPVKARLDRLEDQQKQLRYVGTWQRANGDSYRRNNFVTYGGSVWVALTDQPQHAPGDGGDWQLAVKGLR